MLLTCIFWVLCFFPGYVCARRLGLVPRAAGLLYAVGVGYAGTLLLLTPLSLLGYWCGAPLALWSTGALLLLLAALGYAVTSGGLRELARLLRAEPLVPSLLLLGWLALQWRLGGWLDGDATFHLGRMRVLLEHGFTNRDIYLSEYRFNHAYHSNLLFPLYASAAQLTRQSPLTVWFYTAPWAMLLMAAGHYVLGYCVTQQRRVGYLLALCASAACAGETYLLYPNLLAVAWLTPMALGLGAQLLVEREREAQRCVWQLAALVLVLAQVHALYAVYLAALLALPLGLRLVLAGDRRQRLQLVAALLSLGIAAPFVAVSNWAYRDQAPLRSAPDDEPAPEVLTPVAGLAPEPPAGAEASPLLAASGGHLEKVLDSVPDGSLIFRPERMGGLRFVVTGVIGLLVAFWAWPARRWCFAALLLATALLAAALFTRAGVAYALVVFRAPFVVARLATLLALLCMLGITASLGALLSRFDKPLLDAAGCLLLTAAATQLTGQAPLRFEALWQAALAPASERHALLDRLEARRALLARTVPAGATILTTPRFARQVVMLRDCYVLAADRGHTYLEGVRTRRSHLIALNAAGTPWPTRARYLEFYQLGWVVFEQRWHNRYSWAYEHGRVVGSEAGLDVILLDR